MLKLGTNVTARTLTSSDMSLDITEGVDEVDLKVVGTSPAEIAIQEEGSEVQNPTTFINFIGDIVTATANGAGADITIVGTIEPVRIIVGGTATDVDFVIVE